MPSLATISLDALSEKSGVDVKTIRAYERGGLLPKPRRVAGNILLYRTDDIERLNFIKHALALGFSVEAVRELLGLPGRKPPGCAAIHEIAERHLANLRRRIAELTRMESVLAPLVGSCARQGGSAECPILATFSGQPHPSLPARIDEGAETAVSFARLQRAGGERLCK